MEKECSASSVPSVKRVPAQYLEVRGLKTRLVCWEARVNIETANIEGAVEAKSALMGHHGGS